jgi:hypothetical protein
VSASKANPMTCSRAGRTGAASAVDIEFASASTPAGCLLQLIHHALRPKRRQKALQHFCIAFPRGAKHYAQLKSKQKKTVRFFLSPFWAPGDMVWMRRARETRNPGIKKAVVSAPLACYQRLSMLGRESCARGNYYRSRACPVDRRLLNAVDRHALRNSHLPLLSNPHDGLVAGLGR